MKLPEQFDSNEWLLSITLLVVIAVFIFLPKRLPRTITILVFVVALYLGKVTDTLLSLDPNNWYDINDSHKFELFDFITWIIYSFFGYFLIYLYDLLKPKGAYTWLYITVWSLCSAGFETFSVKMGAFNYHGWNVAASYIFYLFAISAMIGYFHFIQKQFLKMRSHKDDRGHA